MSHDVQWIAHPKLVESAGEWLPNLQRLAFQAVALVSRQVPVTILLRQVSDSPEDASMTDHWLYRPFLYDMAPGDKDDWHVTVSYKTKSHAERQRHGTIRVYTHGNGDFNPRLIISTEEKPDSNPGRRHGTSWPESSGVVEIPSVAYDFPLPDTLDTSQIEIREICSHPQSGKSPSSRDAH